jgi:cell fate (sporulation/competence/biofilm development) regulator YlbF (YheA/YmcA/DUF963 family)
MEDLLRKAEDLGKSLAEHARFKALMAARDGVVGDPEAQKLLGGYQQQAEKVERLAYENKPIEAADKQRLAQLEGAVASNDKLKKLMEAQADFSELMSKVNRAIYGEIVPPEQVIETPGE